MSKFLLRRALHLAVPAAVRVMVRVRRPTHAFRRAFWQCTLSTYTRIKVRGDSTVFTKRADQRYTVTCMCVQKGKEQRTWFIAGLENRNCLDGR